jgi:hypothetical protein
MQGLNCALQTYHDVAIGLDLAFGALHRVVELDLLNGSHSFKTRFISSQIDFRG